MTNYISKQIITSLGLLLISTSTLEFMPLFPPDYKPTFIIKSMLLSLLDSTLMPTIIQPILLIVNFIIVVNCTRFIIIIWLEDCLLDIDIIGNKYFRFATTYLIITLLLESVLLTIIGLPNIPK